MSTLNVTNETRKSIVKKIHKYIGQKKLANNEMNYILRLFEMDSTASKPISENETGMLLVVNDYCADTFLKINDFLTECENNWNKKKEDKLFPVKRKSTEKPSRGTNAISNINTVNANNNGTAAVPKTQTKPTKKVKTVANPLLRETDFEQPNVSPTIDPPTIATVAANTKGSETKHVLHNKLRIIDNKKHPLAYYKGPWNRMMRTARNISTLPGIADYNKKYTSEFLGSGLDASSTSIMTTSRSPFDENIDLDTIQIDEEDEDYGVDDEMGGDEDNSEIGKDFDQLSRKYEAVKDSIGDNDVDDDDEEDDGDDDDDDDDGDDDDEDEGENGPDAAGDDDDEDVSVEYSQ